MLFNSFEFIFLFLPITLLIFLYTQKKGGGYSLHWLIGASLLFYAWWSPIFLLFLLFSTIINYFLGKLIRIFHKKIILILGLLFNLGWIVYYKYIDFMIFNMNAVFSTHFSYYHPILPLAISFFTFQQIAYLVDTYKAEKSNYTFLEYIFFVSFFPQLVAGPIVQHHEIIPQIKTLSFTQRNLHIGLCYFVLGLCKKVLFAESCAYYANPIFQLAGDGTSLSFCEAWLGAIAYSLQLYFDFSGYSDMAIGLGRLFNVKLPVNFNAPYQATSIIDFWRRWHITLSLFLRNYLYIPLGGNRKGHYRQLFNILTTMLLGGLWHGANWTFVAWGGLHGVLLCGNHLWRDMRERYQIFRVLTQFTTFKYISIPFTFMIVTFTWVYFRSDTISQANGIIQSMLGFNGFSFGKAFEAYFNLISFHPNIISFNGFFPNLILNYKMGCLLILTLVSITFFGPNTHRLMRFYQKDAPYLSPRWTLSSSAISAFFIGLAAMLSILFISKATEFLYFQF